MTWLSAFALTLVVEVPVWTVLLHLTGASWSRAAGTAVAVNAVSHPLLWFVVLPLLEQIPAIAGSTAVALGEVAVVVVEAGLAGVLTGADRGVRVAVSVAANAASLGMGLVLAAM